MKKLNSVIMLVPFFLSGCYSKIPLTMNKNTSEAVEKIERSILSELYEIKEIEKKYYAINSLIYQHCKDSGLKAMMQQNDERYLDDLQAFYRILKQRKLYLEEKIKKTTTALRADTFPPLPNSTSGK